MERRQRLVRIPSRAKPVREPEEVAFVDGIEHFGYRTLHQLVFQSGNSEGPLTAIRFGDLDPTHR